MGTHAATSTIDWRWIGRAVAFALAIALVLAWWAPQIDGHDAYQWWTADLSQLYTHSVLNVGGFAYSPAFAQAITPLQALPWPVFLGAVLAASLGASVWLVGPWLTLLFLVGQLPAMVFEIRLAEMNFLIAAAIWAGFRWPALWSVVLLTKLTPGVGLLWFALRREWRALGIALGMTAAIAGISFVIAPNLWAEWFGFLWENVDQADAIKIVPLPVRFAASVAVVLGSTDRPCLGSTNRCCARACVVSLATRRWHARLCHRTVA